MGVSESTHTYFLATEQHLARHGKPIAFYSDKLSVFKINNPTNQETIMTQVGRVVSHLLPLSPKAPIFL